VLDDLHALVEFAQAGFIAGAADRLYRTPSAITRQLQRPGAALQIPITSRLMLDLVRPDHTFPS
jgi:DNA-binding transcriptional LysR family regulator